MNLLRALATVSSMTFLSRVLGYVRDYFIARTFDVGGGTDAFFVAFRIPNLLRRMFAEGAFSQAFVPILSEYRNRESPEDTRALVDAIATLLFMALVVATVIGMLAAPLIAYVFAPNWFHTKPEQFGLTVQLLRITFPYILFISLVALAAGVLNTWSRFAVPAFTPVLLNVSFIVAAAFFAERFEPPIVALAWAVFVGGALQLALQFPFLARIGMLPRWRLDWRHRGLTRVRKLMLPAIFGVSASQISLLINTIFASFLVTGSVTWLYYADRLMEFPAGLLGVAVGTILLPSLSRHYAGGDADEYGRLLDWGLRLTLLLALPAAAALAVLAVPLISTLFHYGRFGAEDVWMTRQALVAYSLGLVGMILVKVLAPGFYARQNVMTPVKIGVLTLAATQLMNLAFIVPFKHAGLALSVGLGACLNAGLLYRALRKAGIYVPQPGWGPFAAKTALAVCAMAALLHFVMPSGAWWLQATWQHKVPAIAGLVLLGALAYGALLLALGFRPRDFARREPS
ncbi:MAG TPA: murein biosynthesis integral membrane protein MurJ [Burkholderiales bacterium]|nr:murein biosynthesis integral membrane protein MurJ [Burkholderiales bacterium]